MEIKICGVGGQGLGFAGRLLGEAAMRSRLHAAQTTAYGVESRGGLSTADIVISEGAVVFPEVRRPDGLLLMAEKGLQANLRGAHDGTLILYDSGTVHQLPDCPGKKYAFPFNEIALKEIGNRESATIIGLGALTALTGVVPFEVLEETVIDWLPKKTHEINIKALRMGRQLQ